jgi:hypothetical protein
MKSLKPKRKPRLMKVHALSPGNEAREGQKPPFWHRPTAERSDQANPTGNRKSTIGMEESVRNAIPRKHGNTKRIGAAARSARLVQP